MQENNFFFKKSMRKHIFKTFNIFYIKRNIQNMLEYWPYATHKNIFVIIKKKHKHHLKSQLKSTNHKSINYVETCSYIFTGNTTWFYLSFRYLTIYTLKHSINFLPFLFYNSITYIKKNKHTHIPFLLYFFWKCCEGF